LVFISVLLGFLPSVSAAPQVLESSALRVEFQAKPYLFRVIERSSGNVLLSESNTAVYVRDEMYPVLDATDVVANGNTVRASLMLQLDGRNPLPPGIGGKLDLTLQFVSPEVIQVHITFTGSKDQSVSEEFDDRGEHYYGIWEYPFGGNIDNRGADWDFMGLRNQRYAHHSSVRAPFYFTSGKYGVYVDSTSPGHFSIAQAGKTSFSFETNELKYSIIYGPSYAEILKRYNEMAGPPVLPPLWAFDSIWWRDDYHEDPRDAANAQEKVIQDADRLRSLHIPASTIWLDRPYASGDMGWGNMDFDSVFPDPAKMIADLNDRGMHLLVWIANRASGKLFQEGSAHQYLFPGDWPAVDIRRPEVYNWFKDELNSYVRQGVQGYKIDRGDENEVPRPLENLNAILFPKLAAEGLRAAYGDDYFEFSRNANDTARRYTAVWSGDPWNTFSGLQMSVKNALRSGMIDFPMWGCDTGGYFSVPTKELFARWLEFTAFSPMMEILIGPKRTIWYDYDPELTHIAQTYVSLHHDLIPYTRSYLYQATQTGMPVMRALALAYPSDATVSDVWNEYLYGPDLLVAPVLTPGASSRDVYLPPGEWMNYNDRATTYRGGLTVSVDAPLGITPLFVREGAIVVRGDILKSNNNWQENWKRNLRVEVFPSADSSSEFDYYAGDAVRKIEVKPTAVGLTIQTEDLGSEGTLEVYCGSVQAVTKNGTALREGTGYRYDDQKRRLTLLFNGPSTFVIRGASSLF